MNYEGIFGILFKSTFTNPLDAQCTGDNLTEVSKKDLN